MNLVVVSHEDLPLDPNAHQIVSNAYLELVRLLSSHGKPLPEFQRSQLHAFLVTTPELLRTLREARPIPSQIIFRVFTLSSPKEQIVGGVDEATQLDPDSYLLGKIPQHQQGC